MVSQIKNEFLPILLGTDANAYGMARSFHEKYGVNSIAIGTGNLLETSNSKIVKVITKENFTDKKVFCAFLIKFAKEKLKEYKKLILIACGDNYSSLIIDNKEELEKYFIVPYIGKTLKNELENKTTFYKMCDKYNIDYPKTYICEFGSDILPKNMKFPVAVKAADSISYSKCSFSKKKKSYKSDSIEDLKKIIKCMRDGNYNKDIIIQDFIPGNDSCMYVLNSYSDSKGKVKMMCLGNCILEDYSPNLIGNYNAIISTYNKDIYLKIKNFLESINYVGYSNFDIKYDYRDKKYKVFEINIRQGRSSYFTTASGLNMAKYIVDDYFNGTDNAVEFNKKKNLWLFVPMLVLKKYSDKKAYKEAKKLLRTKNFSYNLLYKKDLSLRRILKILILYVKKIKLYKMYYNKRNIDD